MRLLAALPLLWVGLAHAGPTSLGPNYDVKADVAETCAACHGLRYLDLAQGYDTPAVVSFDRQYGQATARARPGYQPIPRRKLSAQARKSASAGAR